MALSDIIDFTVDLLLAIPDIGIVLDYQPTETEPEDTPAIMGSGGDVHFTTVRRETTVEERRTTHETERRHTLVIRSYREVNSPAISEPLFQAQLEAMMTMLRERYRIMGPGNVVLAELVGPLQLVEPVGWRMLGNTRTAHFAQMTLAAQELIRRT